MEQLLDKALVTHEVEALTKGLKLCSDAIAQNKLYVELNEALAIVGRHWNIAT